jgi:hypothetical protein
MNECATKYKYDVKMCEHALNPRACVEDKRLAIVTKIKYWHKNTARSLFNHAVCPSDSESPALVSCFSVSSRLIRADANKEGGQPSLLR